MYTEIMSGINWENAIDVEDYVAAPASEAYVVRIFSLAGMLSTGKRNRMSKSREMRDTSRSMPRLWIGELVHCAVLNGLTRVVVANKESAAQ